MRILLTMALLAVPAVAGDEEDVRAVFAAIARAEAQHDPHALADRFDLDALVAGLGLEGAFPQTLRDNPQLLFTPLAPRLPSFAEARIRLVRITGEGKATVVLDSGSVVDRIRWFLARRPDGTWLLTDFEILGLGIRLSTVLKAGPGAARTLDGARARGMAMALQQVETLLDEERFDEVWDLLSKLEATGVAPLDAVLWIGRASASLGMGEVERALEECDRAETLCADLPVLHYLRAYAHNDLGEFDAVVAEATKLIEAVGESAEMRVLVGDAHAAAGRTEEALAAYRAALKEDPAHADAVGGLLVTLPADAKDEALKAFRSLPDPASDFDDLAFHCDDWEDWTALALLVKEQRTLRPDDPDADYWEARVCYERGAFGEAAALWRSGWAKVGDPDERLAYVEWYLDAMMKADRAVEGYRNAPDRAYAFGYIADLCADDEDAGALEALVEARSTEPEPGLALVLWRAEAAWLRGNYAVAADLLDKNVAAIEEADLTGSWRAEDRLVRSLYRLGRIDAAAERADDLDLVLLVHAARGDAAGVVRAFDACVEDGWDPDFLYGDDDLGPLLRDARFKDLHARHPPPPE